MPKIELKEKEHYHSLKLPKICFQKLDNKNVDIPVDLYSFILKKVGFLIIDINFDNNESILENIVAKLGRAHTHSTDEDAIWHIKQGGPTGNDILARSHRLDEFVLHTDCSYEPETPNFFALQCIHSDKLGGGKNLFVDASTLIQHLSHTSLKILQSELVEIRVPPEFKRGVDTIHAYIIDANFNIRYRRELIVEPSLSERLKVALNEFEHLCHSPLLNRWFELNDNQVLILDNRRYLHARTKIHDRKRHLLRIRFFMDNHNPMS